MIGILRLQRERWPSASMACPASFRYPIVVGGGTPFLPPVSEAVALELIEARTMGLHVVYERYGRAAR